MFAYNFIIPSGCRRDQGAEERQHNAAMLSSTLVPAILESTALVLFRRHTQMPLEPSKEVFGGSESDTGGDFRRPEAGDKQFTCL